MQHPVEYGVTMTTASLPNGADDLAIQCLEVSSDEDAGSVTIDDRVDEEEAGFDEDEAKLISAIRSNSGAGGAMISVRSFML